jgi:uncharacterized lipoprotein YmbA
VARRIAHLMVPIALLAAAASACGTTAPSQFYTLDATAVPDGAGASELPDHSRPVSVPAAVDRPEFVVQTAPNRVDVDEFNRWDAPLNDAIAQAVAGDLVKLLGTPDVATAPLANFEPAYRVTIEVQRFDSVPGQSALVEAMWTVHRTEGDPTDFLAADSSERQGRHADRVRRHAVVRFGSTAGRVARRCLSRLLSRQTERRQ